MYEPGYLDAVGQVWQQKHAGDWSLEQTACFLRLHTMIGSGEVARAKVYVGTSPERDNRRQVNAASLRNLPTPFVADVDQDQHCGDDDGCCAGMSRSR